MVIESDHRIAVPECPWLPKVEERLDFSVTRRHGSAKGEAFYRDALRYAQSQWLAGKPAQAILQLNKSWAAERAHDVPADPRLSPYRALVWMLRMGGRGEYGFVGNPVRHFQHLASRMRGAESQVRIWRAWVCFHLAEKILEAGQFPRDGHQIAREGLWIPGKSRAVREVSERGREGELDGVFDFLC